MDFWKCSSIVATLSIVISYVIYNRGNKLLPIVEGYFQPEFMEAAMALR